MPRIIRSRRFPGLKASCVAQSIQARPIEVGEIDQVRRAIPAWTLESSRDPEGGPTGAVMATCIRESIQTVHAIGFGAERRHIGRVAYRSIDVMAFSREVLELSQIPSAMKKNEIT